MYLEEMEEVYNNTLTGLNGGIPVKDEELQSIIAAQKNEDILGSQVGQPAQVEPQYDSDLATSRGLRYREKLSKQVQADMESGAISDPRYNSIIKYNPELREKRSRQLVHDIAKQGSAEQGVIDMFSLWNAVSAEGENAKLLTVDEANALAKEYGIEVKFDRPTSEAEINWIVAKKQKEQSMMQELAYLKENTDSSAMQGFMEGCSAISGAVGFYELAGTAGLSLLGGVGVAGALGRFAGTANNITKAIRLAQKAEMAQKRAKTVGNVLNDIKYAEVARRRGFGASLAYDTYRFGKGVQGTHASLATTMIPFAVDGVVSDLPRIAAMSIDSDITHSGRYTGQDILTELMAAGLIGGSLPTIKAGWRVVKPPREKIAEAATKKVRQDTANKVSEAMEVGHVGEAELAQEIGDGAEKEVKTLFEDLDEAATPTEAAQQYADNIAEFSGANFKEEESAFLMEEGRKRLMLGLPMQPLIDMMPCKTPWFSTVSDMLNMMKESVAGKLSARDFHNMLIERGYLKASEASSNTVFDDILSFLGTGSKYSVKLAGNGALEQKSVIGWTQDMMEKLHYNIYKARILDDTEEGVEAGLYVENQLNQLAALKEQLVRIRDKNLEYIDAKKIKGEGVPYKQQNEYQLSDGSFGRLENALDDLADLFVPEEIREEMAYLKHIVDSEQMTIAEIGHPRPEMTEVLERYSQMQEMYGAYKKSFIDALGDYEQKKGSTYFNLRREKNSNLARMDRLIKDVDEMLQNADELYNSDLVFYKKYGDPEKVKKIIEDGQEIPELEYGYNRSRTSAQTKEELQQYDTAVRRNETLRAELDAYRNEEDEVRFPLFKKLQSLSGSIKRALSKSKDRQTSRFEDLNNWIEGLGNIVASNFAGEKSSLLNSIKSSTALVDLIKSGATLDKIKKSTALMITYKEAKDEFAKIIKSNLYDPFVGSTTPGTFSYEAKNINEAVKKATDEFFAKLGSDNAWNEVVKPQQEAETVVTSTEEAAKRIAEIGEGKVSGEEALINEVADPIIQELKAEAVKLQAEEMMNLKAVYNAAERCLDTNLGRVDELILAFMSGTYVNAKQGSVSVAALSKDISTEYSKFINLCRKESESIGTSLEDYFRNPNNWEDIQKALIDVDRFEAGLMSEEEKVAFNRASTKSLAGRIAHVYHKVCSDMAEDIYNLGASKYNTFSVFDNNKVRNLRAYLKRDSFSSDFFNKLPDNIKARFQTHHNQGEANAALAFMEWLDLDKHFLTNSDSFSFNELRDAVVEGRYAAFAEEHEADINNIWAELYDRILSDDKTGFVPRLGAGSDNIAQEFSNMRSHYIDGLEPRFYFKNGDAYKEAASYMGYDNLRQMFENNTSSAKKAYAVLSLVGTDPNAFTEDLVAMSKHYARTVVRNEHGDEAARIMLDRLGSKTFETKLNTLTTATCGNYTSPVSNFVKWGSMLLQVLGSPLIMKSAAKGVADYENIYQYLISAGLAQNTSRAEVWSGLSAYLKSSKTSELIDDLLLSQPFMVNALHEAATGAPTTVAAGESWADIIASFTGKNLGKYATKEDRAAGAVKSLTDGVLKMGCVTTAAEKNRSVAAMQLMRNIGREARDKSFIQMDQRFRDLLGRYGIDEAEWNDIFRKHGVQNVDEYLSKMKGEKVELLGDERFFLPNNIINLSEDVVRDFMKAHPDKFPVINDMTVSRYRTSLANKASILINDAADEMCCIPNARIKSMLLMDSDPNTRTGLAWRALTQFQSFGASLLWYHWGRRAMSFLSQTDNLFTRNAFLQYAMSTGGWGAAAPMALSMTGMVAECAFVTFLINEALSAVSGTRQAFRDREGNWQLDAIGKKAARAVVDQTGALGVGLDAVMGVFDFGRGSGGGLALSVAPVPSSLISGAAKVAQAGMRPGNEGRRLQAMGAQTVSNLMQTTGIPRHPMLQAIYTMTLGDYLDQMSMGDEAYNRRYMRRYKDNYMNPVDARDKIKSIFTN